MDFDQLTILIEKYQNGTITGPEEKVLRDWYRDNEAGEVIWSSDMPDERSRVEDRMLARLQKDIQRMRRDGSGDRGVAGDRGAGGDRGVGARRQVSGDRGVEAHGEGTGYGVIAMRRRRVVMAAAVIGFVLLSGAGYLFWPKPPVAAGVVKASLPVADLLPATNRATLVLSDGKTIVLDSVGNGLLAEQGEARVKKTAQGQLSYQVAGAMGDGQGNAGGQRVAGVGPNDILYNTILTPQGGTYTITLSDGTKVWLNAGTSLKYPTAFTGASRGVELKGEAYFEVAPDVARPFTVTGGGQTIRVLGTHFNINAYDNEPVVRTTLLQGSVKVVRDGRELILRPGEQSLLTGAGSLRVRKDIDTVEVMAWKNGMFQFEEADIGTVMRQIGRWYNVEVVYNGPLPGDHFRGKIPRNVNASEALQILTLSGIQFKIEGRKIILN